jgi:hypothetical protein
MGRDTPNPPQTLDAIRARIDVIDGVLDDTSETVVVLRAQPH